MTTDWALAAVVLYVVAMIALVAAIYRRIGEWDRANEEIERRREAWRREG